MVDTTEFEKMEHVGWNNPDIALGYAIGFDHATQKVARQLCDRVNVFEKGGPQNRILDLCCGHGVVSKELVKRGAITTGLDFSDAMIELAQKSVSGAKFVQGDATKTGFDDAAFDGVTVGFGIPHLPDPAQGFREIARLLKPGGRVAFSIWRGKGSNGSFGWMFDCVGRLGDHSQSLPEGPDAHMFVERDVAQPMLEEAGFTDIELDDVNSEIIISKPEQLFDVFDKGAVRMASLMARQPVDIRRAIRAELAARVVTDGTEIGNGYKVAAPSVVVHATRR